MGLQGLKKEGLGSHLELATSALLASPSRKVESSSDSAAAPPDLGCGVGLGICVWVLDLMVRNAAIQRRRE